MDPLFSNPLAVLVFWDARTLTFVGGVLTVLGVASAAVVALRRRVDSGLDPAIIETFRMRVRAWWVLCTVLAAAFLMGQAATVFLFALIAFWALREFITLTPTRPGDHRTLFWVFFLCTPLQFFLVAMNWYNLYSILIPVYAFLLIPANIALSGDSKRFLERSAKIQAGLLICVYCLSYAPALLTLDLNPLDLPGKNADGGKVRLLFYFIVMVQLSDVLQYAWSQLPSRHVIVPTINPTKTWEGLLGGAATMMLLGATLWWATPFPYWMAAGMGLVIAVMGAAGSLTMSAIKRDRGVKDYGTLVVGHGGVLDRIDSLCFAAPVFFHLTRLYLEHLKTAASG
jgi:phosphatidate cytidylyltransferase